MNARHGWTRRMAWAVALVSIVAGPVAGAKDEVEKATDLLRRTSKAFATVVGKSVPAVVSIRVEKTVGYSDSEASPFEFNDPSQFFGDDFLERFFGSPAPLRRGGRYSPQVGGTTKASMPCAGPRRWSAGVLVSCC